MKRIDEVNALKAFVQAYDVMANRGSSRNPADGELKVVKMDITQEFRNACESIAKRQERICNAAKIYGHDREIETTDGTDSRIHITGLDIDIDRLELPIRAYNALKRLGIKRINDLDGFTMKELMSRRNVGWKTVKLIILELTALGVKVPEQWNKEVSVHIPRQC